MTELSPIHIKLILLGDSGVGKSRILPVLSDIPTSYRQTFIEDVKVPFSLDREVTKLDGSSCASRLEMLFIEASAKSSENVHDAFIELVRKILQTDHYQPAVKDSLTFTADQTQDKTGWCGCS